MSTVCQYEALFSTNPTLLTTEGNCLREYKVKPKKTKLTKTCNRCMPVNTKKYIKKSLDNKVVPAIIFQDIRLY